MIFIITDDKGDLTSTPLTILSFAQYCRYRTVLKRLENMVDKWLRNAIICAIGGIVTKSKNARIMFCKTTVDVPELDDLEIRCDHLGNIHYLHGDMMLINLLVAIIMWSYSTHCIGLQGSLFSITKKKFISKKREGANLVFIHVYLNTVCFRRRNSENDNIISSFLILLFSILKKNISSFSEREAEEEEIVDPERLRQLRDFIRYLHSWRKERCIGR